MSVLGSIFRTLGQSLSGRRTWTPLEVRELIDRRELMLAKQACERLSASLISHAAERACLLGEISFQMREDEAADSHFTEALRAAPGLPEAHYGRSLLLSAGGEFPAALRHVFFAHTCQPNEARFLAQLGYCQLQLRNFSLAERPLRRATLLSPDNAYAWNNLGIVLSLKGNGAEAEDCFRRAVSLLPENASFREHLRSLLERGKPAADEALGGGNTQPDSEGRSSGPSPQMAEVASALRDGRLRDAIELCERLSVESPDDVTVALELNRVHQRAGDPQSGIDSLEAFLSTHPTATEVVGALGLARLEMSEHVEAEVLLKRAIEDSGGLSEAKSVDLLLGLGDALRGQDRFSEAHPLLRRAFELEPGNVRARISVAVNLINMCRYDEGLEACLQLESEGMWVPALGTVLASLGRLDEAETVLDRHIVDHPNDPNLRFQRASVRLLRLDFERGWEDYAYRSLSASQNFRVLPFPLWAGEPLRNKRVVLLAEQGLGDQVMFASCLPDLLRLEPAEVIVEAIHRIAPTIQRSFPQCRVIGSSQSRRLEWLDDCPDMDYYIPLGDLPRYFRRSVEDFPEHRGFLVPNFDRVAHWKQQLEATGPGPWVGVSWKGGTEATRTALRSVSALDFKGLSDCGRATWVCLQYGKVADEVQQANEAGFQMAYWPEAIEDLDDFAALVAALDLVISVCNTTVHYAGALGRPVWVLAPAVPEWRYGAANPVMPWYPSSRLYRQTKAGEWGPVFVTLQQDLSAWSAAE